MPRFPKCFAVDPGHQRNALLGAAIALSIGLAAPGPAAANEQRQTCIDTSNMVATIITLRAKGTRPNAIKRSLKTGNNKVAEKYTATVDPLVDWVFTIDKALVEQPTAPEAIAGEYRKTCVGYQP